MKRSTALGLGLALVAGTTGYASMALADAGNGYDGMLHSPTVATSKAPTVAPDGRVTYSGDVTPATASIPAVTCDVDWCAVTIGPNDREILIYSDGPTLAWLVQSPITIDAPERSAS